MNQFESIILREVSELGDPNTSRREEAPDLKQTAGAVATNLAKLLIGKENIMAKVRRVLRNPSIDELFSWAWAPRKSKTYSVEPVKGDEVIINGIPGFKKYRVGNEILQVMGTIAAKKISKTKYYYEIDAVIPRDLKTDDIQLDFSLIGKSKIGKITFLKGPNVREYPCKVTMLEQNKWSVSIVTEIDVKSVPASPGLEDAKAVATAGRILNNYLGIQNRSQLEGNLSGYLTSLSIMAERIRDSNNKDSILDQLSSLAEETSKTENFENLDIKNKLDLFNNKLNPTK